jgi:predicted nucleic-acid-binding Zn-ribbon protein
MSIWNGFRRGAKAILQGEGACSFAAGGRKIRCPHCESEGFFAKRVLLNTYGMTLLNLDWANKEATTLTCDRCGMIQWFGVAPERVAKPPHSEDVFHVS